MAREELKWQNIDADDLPAAVRKSFDAMVEAEATFKADLEKLLKNEGHMPEDKFLVMSRAKPPNDTRPWGWTEILLKSRASRSSLPSQLSYRASGGSPECHRASFRNGSSLAILGWIEARGDARMCALF
jgi:hypothetical protein